MPTQKYDSLFAAPPSPQGEDFLTMLSSLPPEQLQAMFEPYQQEQGVLDQQMQLAQQLRQPGRQHSSPIGALLGGLSDATGNVGGAVLQQRGLDAQGALGSRTQKDATGRMDALIGALRKRQGGP